VKKDCHLRDKSEAIKQIFKTVQPRGTEEARIAK
jgi:hypothetical protein